MAKVAYWLGRAWARVSAWVMPLLFGAGFFLAAMVGYRQRLSKEREAGADEEARRIDEEARRQQTERKEHADAVRDETDRLPDDDLGERMREQARSRPRGR